MNSPTIKKIKAARRRTGSNFACFEENYASDLQGKLPLHEAAQFLRCGVCEDRDLPCLYAVDSVTKAKKCLQKLLVDYIHLGGEQFSYLIKNEYTAPLCENLFFCYIAERGIREIFVIHDGLPYDLNNNPIKFAESWIFKLMHPIDVSRQHDFIFRLEIEQPIEQINLQIFEPSYEDTANNFVSKFDGALITYYSLRRRLNEEGFFISVKHGYAYKKLGGVLCVLDYTWTSGSPKMCRLGRVNFYDANTYKRILDRSQMKRMDIRAVEGWIYSECMRRIGKCISK